MAKPGLAQDAL